MLIQLILKGQKRLNEICKGIAEAHGAEIKIQFDLVNKYPPTINSKKESMFAGNVAKKIFGVFSLCMCANTKTKTFLEKLELKILPKANLLNSFSKSII